MIQGSCLCGGIRFEVDEVALITTCHCSKCRKSRGSAFSATASVRIEDFRYLAGEELVQVMESTTETYTPSFCRTCGSPAPWVLTERGLVGIPAGLLDDDPAVRPALHMFVESKAPWWEITDDLPRFDEWVPGYEPETKPSKR